MLTSPLSPQEAASLLMKRRAARSTFLTFATEFLEPYGQAPAAHHRLIGRELQDIATGNNDRLMILLPPGSAKSTYASVIYPAWHYTQHPDHLIIAASHTAGLAETFGRRVRNAVTEHAPLLGYGVDPGNSAAGRWQTTTGGGYYAVGVGGSVTGRRADLILVDDPVASREDAESKTIRDKTWEWYRADLYTRLKPGGRIVVIQTRWHSDDLGGRLLEEQERGTGDKWRVIKLPALALENDPLGRQPGEALWPAWENEQALARKRAAVGERDWQALYQQDPRPGTGGLFKTANIQVVDAAPVGGTIVRAWDLAATAQVGTRDPDWTVGAKLARYDDGRFGILNIARERGGPDDVERLLVGTAGQDGRGVRISIPQDPGQAGKSQVLYLTRKLLGFTVESGPETGDKATRAAPFASQVNAGNVFMVRAPWNGPLLDEMSGFPSVAHDDQVDALSRAFGMLVAPPTPAAWTPTTFSLGR